MHQSPYHVLLSGCVSVCLIRTNPKAFLSLICESKNAWGIFNIIITFFRQLDKATAINSRETVAVYKYIQHNSG